MENSRPSETLNPHRRRRSLKSETHRILVRILSHCYDESCDSVSAAVQNVSPPEPNQDTGSKDLGETSEKEAGGNVELVEPDDMNSSDSAAKQVMEAGESCDTTGFRDKIELIEDFLSVDENDLGQLGVMDFNNDLGKFFYDLELGPEMLMVEETEQILKGNDDDTPKGVEASVVPTLVEVELLNNHVENDKGESDEHSFLKTNTLDVEPVIQRVGTETSVSSGGGKESLIPITEVAETEVPEHSDPKEPEAFTGTSKPCESEDKSLSLRANDMEVEHVMQPKENDLEMVHARNAAASSNHDEDVEEGELSEDDRMDERSTDMLLPNTERSEGSKVNAVQISKDVIVQEFDSHSPQMSIVDKAQNPRVELIEGTTRPIGRPGIVHRKTVESIYNDPFLENRRFEVNCSRVDRGISFQALHEKSLENNEAGSCGTTSDEKEDADASNKRKRGPASKERKQRKKKRERLKRAENNRKLGVKRLKLHSIEKPKAVVYCRHYIAGRCHEGDKCKFSHDTVPLKKSKPCSYFAHQSCMKGDDCPYDHELSKYPCDKFVTNGFCSRGDRCLFSHKIATKEDSSIAASKPELVPPSVRGDSRSAAVKINSPSLKHTQAMPHSTGTHSQNNTELIMARALLEQSAITTKEFSFLSTGKPSLVHPGMSAQGFFSAGMSTGAKAGNLRQHSPSSTILTSKENLTATPLVVTPKGINFLSFGKVSIEDSSGKIEVLHQANPSVSETVPNSNGILKENPKGINFLSYGKASPDDSSGKIQVHHQANPSVSETVPNSNGILKVDKSAEPNGTGVLSLGKVPLGTSTGNPFSLSSSSDNANNWHYSESQSVSGKPQKSSAILLRLPPSPLLSGQSSNYTATRFHEDTVNKRSLHSTLAFAAKYQTKTTNQSVGPNATHADNETKQNDSGKAFNILHFLSNIGSTSKQ